MPLHLPKSRDEIDELQRVRKRHAVEQARRARFYAGRLDHIDLRKLDDPSEWRKIPILDKDMLRSLSDRDFYDNFCLQPRRRHCRILALGRFYRHAALLPAQFQRHRMCSRVSPAPSRVRLQTGRRGAFRFPSGSIRSANDGALGKPRRDRRKLGRLRNDHAFTNATRTDSAVEAQHLDGHEQLRFAFANLAEANGIDLAAGSVATILCSAEPLSDSNAKNYRANGARKCATLSG